MNKGAVARLFVVVVIAVAKEAVAETTTIAVVLKKLPKNVKYQKRGFKPLLN